MSASYYIVRDFLGLVLLASGAAKFADIRRSAVILRSLGMRSSRAEFTMWLLAALEFIVGMAIFSGRLLVPIDVIVFLLFVGFLAVMLLATRRARGVRCRCFGSLSSTAAGTKGVLRNGGFVLLGVAALGAHRAELDAVPVAWSPALLLLAALFAICSAVAAQAIDRTSEVRG